VTLKEEKTIIARKKEGGVVIPLLWTGGKVNVRRKKRKVKVV